MTRATQQPHKSQEFIETLHRKQLRSQPFFSGSTHAAPNGAGVKALRPLRGRAAPEPLTPPPFDARYIRPNNLKKHQTPLDKTPLLQG